MKRTSNASPTVLGFSVILAIALIALMTGFYWQDSYFPIIYVLIVGILPVLIYVGLPLAGISFIKLYGEGKRPAALTGLVLSALALGWYYHVTTHGFWKI